ncbi:MAG: lysophospholipid acyltransferase family protein [Bacteroidia bacterium]
MHKAANLLYVSFVILTFIIWVPLVVLAHIFAKILADPHQRLRFIYKVHRIWIGLWEALTRIQINVEDHHKVDPEQTYMFVANHNNLLDVPVVGSCIQHPWKSLVKKEIIDIPILGWIIGNISIPVDRSSKISRSKSLLGMQQNLKEGTSILVFPEGTRNRSEQVLKKFHMGAFRAAIEAQVPIIPIIMIGSREMQPVDTMEFYPGLIQMRFLDPVPTKGLSSNDEATLRDKLYSLMEAELLDNDPYFQPKFGNPVHYSV